MWMRNISLPISYVPISDEPKLKRRRSLITLAFSSASAATLFLVYLILLSSSEPGAPQSLHHDHVPVFNRGVSEGVSDKSTGMFLSSETSYNWTNNMLSWQRTGFHFQPPKNWMNDPDAPFLYKGLYHLFYQYNPDLAVWGNITWGHAVSRDLINWSYLPPSMVRDQWYDINGVWTGSATVLPDDKIIILYTGSTNESAQVQNVAVPADPSDPLLVRWIKSKANPVLDVPPPGIGQKDFRDPTSGWYVESTSSWRVAIGSKNSDHAGIVLVYETEDFMSFKLLPTVLHEVAGTGMWECVDFYPVETEDGVKHVLKASLDDEKHDYYAIGVYDPGRNLWVPDDPENDVGVGLRLDYGKYYASKSFYDGRRRRRVVWGWTGETDSERTDLMKGWASLQTIPRTVSYDKKTKKNLIQWPVEEVESLRLRSLEHTNIALPHGSMLPIDFKYADQMDITAEFEIESSTFLRNTSEADVEYNCSTSDGSRQRGNLGPFGLLVLADDALTEQTAVYFYITRGVDGSFHTFFCQDELRSSKANDILKRIYGSVVPVLNGENLSVRILVDHSIVESFAQGGRTCITSRVYPTRAIYGAAQVFLFNNATISNIMVRSLKIWQMKSAFIRPFSEGKDRQVY